MFTKVGVDRNISSAHEYLIKNLKIKKRTEIFSFPSCDHIRSAQWLNERDTRIMDAERGETRIKKITTRKPQKKCKRLRRWRFTTAFACYYAARWALAEIIGRDGGGEANEESASSRLVPELRICFRFPKSRSFPVAGESGLSGARLVGRFRAPGARWTGSANIRLDELMPPRWTRTRGPLLRPNQVVHDFHKSANHSIWVRVFAGKEIS